MTFYHCFVLVHEAVIDVLDFLIQILSYRQVAMSELTSQYQLLIASLSTSTNLVDPASSHMLVSKIKPCKSKYKLLIRRNCE